MMNNSSDIYSNEHNLQTYYKWHAPIYDATRWSFLFGREHLLDMIPELPPSPRILEIGCGTGTNIRALQYTFPDAQITGIDLSSQMLDKARRKMDSSSHLNLLNEKYGMQKSDHAPFDLILLSYSIAMMHEEVDKILQQTTIDLKKNGSIAVVDFHDTSFKWFRRWMNSNHVTLNGSTLPLLNKYYRPLHTSIEKAYLGLWSYFIFIGAHS